MRLPRGLPRAKEGRILFLLVPLAAASLAAIAGVVGAQSATGLRECERSERLDVLRTEQAAVLERLVRFRVLRNAADVAALAKPPLNYVFLAHRYTSIRGLGLTIINPFDTPRAGVPNLLFYGPAQKATSVTDPQNPDFPYTLVGWGYGVPYEPGRIPAIVACTGVKDWHVHERGVHPFSTGGMKVMPPTENLYGESAGTLPDPPAMNPAIGFPHGRSWTVHFWIGKNGVPLSSILDPIDPPAGIDPGLGSSFFFPEQQSTGVRAAAQASSVPGYALGAGDGETVKLRDSPYTIKSGDKQSGGAFTVIEITLHHGSEPPMHIHHREVEAFYVLAGELTFFVGGQTLPVTTGAFILLPRGVPHGYVVRGSGVARLLLISAPPGLERFFRAAAPNPADLKVAQKYGIEPVGPPPGGP